MDDFELQTALESHHRESFGWAATCCLGAAVEPDVVLQTVYWKILAGKARYDGRASFKTWLFAVIRRTATDERRRYLLRRILLDRHASTTARVERPDERLYRAELRRLIREVLLGLPRRQREVLQLVFYHDLSLAEAAQVMSVSTGAAHKHYERAKKKARAQLEEWRIHADTGRTDSAETFSAVETGR